MSFNLKAIHGQAEITLSELLQDEFTKHAFNMVNVTMKIKYNEVVDYGNGTVITELKDVRASWVLDIARSYRKRGLSFWINDSTSGKHLGEYDFDSDRMRIFGTTIA